MSLPGPPPRRSATDEAVEHSSFTQDPSQAASAADFGLSVNANVNSKPDGPEVEALRRNRTGEFASSGRPAKRERPTFGANRRSVPNSLVGSRPGSAEAVQAPHGPHAASARRARATFPKGALAGAAQWKKRPISPMKQHDSSGKIHPVALIVATVPRNIACATHASAVMSNAPDQENEGSGGCLSWPRAKPPH
jgi:hypothetical protein